MNFEFHCVDCYVEYEYDNIIEMPQFCPTCGGDLGQGSAPETDIADVVDDSSIEADDVVDDLGPYCIENEPAQYIRDGFVGGAREMLQQYGAGRINPVRVSLYRSESMSENASKIIKSKTGIIATAERDRSEVEISARNIVFKTPDLSHTVDSVFVGFNNSRTCGFCIPLSQRRDLDNVDNMEIDSLEFSYSIT